MNVLKRIWIGYKAATTSASTKVTERKSLPETIAELGFNSFSAGYFRGGRFVLDIAEECDDVDHDSLREAVDRKWPNDSGEWVAEEYSDYLDEGGAIGPTGDDRNE